MEKWRRGSFAKALSEKGREQATNRPKWKSVSEKSEGDGRRRKGFLEPQHNAEMQVLEAVRLEEEEGEAEGKL